MGSPNLDMAEILISLSQLYTIDAQIPESIKIDHWETAGRQVDEHLVRDRISLRNSSSSQHRQF